jgi:HPt (histidine-containing phosphotransfer) domain-containing protein
MRTTVDNTEKIIDLSYLMRLSNGNKVFVKEMIALFLSENPEEIKSLEYAIREKDYATIKATAHKLRSTIPFIGIDKLIEKDVAEIETLSTEHADISEIESRFSKIRSVCEKACIELTTL